MNVMNIATWQQGHFIDSRKYTTWTTEQKDRAEREENLKVRPYPTGNAICLCSEPQDAKWIADRLNMAAVLEEMTYNFATGKSDGKDIVDYVMKAIR